MHLPGGQFMNIFGYDFCLKLRVRDKQYGFRFEECPVAEIRKILFADGKTGKDRVFYLSGSENPAFVESIASLAARTETIHSGATLLLQFESEDSRKQFFELFQSHFSPISAAGGIPVRPDGKILMIFRKGTWDLPKGKLEKKETIEEGAMREVMEETGIAGITIGNRLPDSYHIFEGKVNWRFKTTYWFMMPTATSGKLLPQAAEGITAVKWMSLKKLYRNPPDTYPLILNVIRQIRNISWV